jgi:hypothetical protein
MLLEKGSLDLRIVDISRPLYPSARLKKTIAGRIGLFRITRNGQIVRVKDARSGAGAYSVPASNSVYYVPQIRLRPGKYVRSLSMYELCQ